MNRFDLINYAINPQPIPAAFNDGYSQYEVLAKLIVQINSYITNMNTAADAIDHIETNKLEVDAFNSAITALLSGITTARKLSPTGDFTGTLDGNPIVMADAGLASYVATLVKKVKFDSVQNFGAVCDGVTDDSAAINAAIQAAAENSILLITGDVKVNSPIVMKSKVHVMCYGDVIASGQTKIIDFTNVNDSSWIGGNISGNATEVTQEGFDLSSACRNTIAPLTVSGCLNKGIAISGVSTDNEIKVQKVSGSSGTTGAGISLYGGDCERNTVSGGYCTENRIGLTINGSHRNRVSNINCSANNICGLMIDGIVTDAGDGGKYNVVVGAVCNDNLDTAYAGLYLGNGSCYNKILSPICNGNTGAGIKTGGTQGVNECNNNTITSPSCESNGAVGINISNSGKNAIVTPLVKGNTGNGITIFKSDYCQITGGGISGNTGVGVKIQSGYTRTNGVRIGSNGTGGYQTATGGSADSSNNIIIGSTVQTNSGFDFNLGAGLTRVLECQGNSKTVADAGDANFSWSIGKETTIIYNTALTALRSVTLSTTNVLNGDKVRVVRNANCTGAFNLNIGTGPLKALTAAGQWCDVEYNGSAWVLVAAGAL